MSASYNKRQARCEAAREAEKDVKNVDTMKWYNLMNKTGMKSMSMFCEEESIKTRLASNLYDFAWNMWNASAKIDRANEYREYIAKKS